MILASCFVQLRPLRDKSREDIRPVMANAGVFNCFGSRELREVPPSVACMPPDPDVADPYVNLTTNQV